METAGVAALNELRDQLAALILEAQGLDLASLFFAAESTARLAGLIPADWLAVLRGGRTEVLEGDWSPRRVVVIEFPSWDQLRAWYDSPAYAPLIALRQRTADARLVMVEGVSGG